MYKQLISRILCLFFCYSLAYSANAKVVAAISTMKGLVMVKPAGSRKYIPAYKGQMLKSGEWLKTKDGVFVAIVFLDGSNIKIQQQTEVKISSYRMTAKDLKTNLEMLKGQAWSNVADQGVGGEFTIKTPTAVASVKGTEFDLKFDEDSGESILTVMSGAVSFSNEIGEIIAEAMEAASASEGSAPTKKSISKEDLPSWQDKTDPGLAFKLKTDVRKQQTGKIIKVGIQVINAKSKAFKKSFSGTVAVNSQNSELLISTNGSSWSSSVDVNISGGRGVIQAKSSRQGKPELIVTAAEAESKIIILEYYQTKSQKRGSQVKLASIASKVGNAKLTKMIEDKVILKSQVTMGSGNVSDVLQKLETGELELEGAPIYIENGDGTVTVKMKVKPR